MPIVVCQNSPLGWQTTRQLVRASQNVKFSKKENGYRKIKTDRNLPKIQKSMELGWGERRLESPYSTTTFE